MRRATRMLSGVSKSTASAAHTLMDSMQIRVPMMVVAPVIKRGSP